MRRTISPAGSSEEIRPAAHTGADVDHAWILGLSAGVATPAGDWPAVGDLRRAAIPGGVEGVAQDAVGDAWGEGGATHLVIDGGTDRVVGTRG